MKVYVVWHQCYEEVLGVFATEEKAVALCESIYDKEEAAGLNAARLGAVWQEFEIDVPDAETIEGLDKLYGEHAERLRKDNARA